MNYELFAENFEEYLQHQIDVFDRDSNNAEISKQDRYRSEDKRSEKPLEGVCELLDNVLKAITYWAKRTEEKKDGKEHKNDLGEKSK